MDMGFKKGDRVVALQTVSSFFYPGFSVVKGNEYTIRDTANRLTPSTSGVMADQGVKVLDGDPAWWPSTIFRKVTNTSTEHKFTNEITKELSQKELTEERIEEPITEPA